MLASSSFSANALSELDVTSEEMHMQAEIILRDSSIGVEMGAAEAEGPAVVTQNSDPELAD
jgi:hypothetical protein